MKTKNAPASLFMHRSLLQEQVGDKIRCNVCERRCLLEKGALGWCRVRENRDGELVTFIYGAVSSMSINPIEKKPFYHFLPGTKAFTAGSWSCNFGCPWCQNWAVSKIAPLDEMDYVSPGEFVTLAEKSGCSGISISFNEPTLSLEWVLDVFRLARSRGLYNIFVSNGYMTPEALNLLIDAGLDALNIDIKGDAPAVRKYCQGINVEKIWAVASRAQARGIHIEIVTVVIPTVNDKDRTLKGIAQRIARAFGIATPWHVNAYFPDYEFHTSPTPLQTMEHARRIGFAAGLEYVYIGNIHGHPANNTMCPRCNTLLIARSGFEMLENKIQTGRCPQCGYEIPGKW